jgi:hypothetical protein
LDLEGDVFIQFFAVVVLDEECGLPECFDFAIEVELVFCELIVIKRG